MKLIIDITQGVYERAKELSQDSHDELLCMKAIANGIPIQDDITRKQLHYVMFGFFPPILDSPYCYCAVRCSECIHKDDTECEVNWWNAKYRGWE